LPQRDQTETRAALKEFDAFIARYPNSSLMPEVQVKQRETRDRLSEADYQVGYFYYRQKWYPGAIDRFKSVLHDDPAFTNRDSVYFYLADSLVKVQKGAEALPYLERLVEEFEKSEHLVMAQKMIGDLKAQALMPGSGDPGRGVRCGLRRRAERKRPPLGGRGRGRLRAAAVHGRRAGRRAAHRRFTGERAAQPVRRSRSPRPQRRDVGRAADRPAVLHSPDDDVRGQQDLARRQDAGLGSRRRGQRVYRDRDRGSCVRRDPEGRLPRAVRRRRTAGGRRARRSTRTAGLHHARP